MPKNAHPLEVVLFDLGGTLVDTRDYVGWAEAAIASGIPIEPEALASALVELNASKGARVADFRGVWRSLLTNATRLPVPEQRLDRFLDELRARPIGGSLYSDAKRCLERLARDRRRLGIISNSVSETKLRECISRCGISGHFELVVSSGTEGVGKPDPVIFRRALLRLDVPPRAAVFVGDDRENDFRGASRAGLHPISDPGEIARLMA